MNAQRLSWSLRLHQGFSRNSHSPTRRVELERRSMLEEGPLIGMHLEDHGGVFGRCKRGREFSKALAARDDQLREVEGWVRRSVPTLQAVLALTRPSHSPPPLLIPEVCERGIHR
jgi:hypothetical protein